MINQFISKIRILKAENTAKTYEAALKALFPSHPDLSESYLLQRITEWQKSGISKNTICLRLSVYKQFLLNLKDKPVDYDSIVKICSQYKPEIKIPTIATSKDVSGLAKSTKNIKYKLIYYLLYHTGIRISEAVNIDLTDIKEDRIVIRNTKNKKERIVSITPTLRKYLDLYMVERHNSSEALLTSTHGRMSVRTIQEVIKKKSTTLHPHSFRHGFCTKLLQNNVDLKSIKELAGHSSLNTTSRYLHVSSDELLNKVNDVYKGE